MNKTFKKIAAMAVAVSVLSAMASCAPKDEGSNAPKLISGGTAATVAGKSGKQDPAAPAATGDLYTVTYKGVAVVPGMYAEDAIKALGEGYVKSAEIDDCDFDGKSTTYDYKSFVLFADNRDGGKFKISTINIKTADVDCGGVTIGSSLDDVRKVYGDPTEEPAYGLRYEKNNIQIQFVAGGDKIVTSILFKTI